MDNAQKAIMIGVGLFITVLVVAAIMTITGIGTDLVNSGTNQLSGLSSQLQQQLTNEYDGVEISGSKVLSAVNQYYNSDDLVMVVYNTEGSYASTDAAWVTKKMIELDTVDEEEDRVQVSGDGSKEDSNRESLNKYTNSSNDPLYRVITTGTYMAKLIENNGAVVGIACVRLDD